MDYSLPGFSVRGILQARLLEIAISFSRGVFPTQGSNPGPTLQADSSPSELPGNAV